jgi:hypothetical protein
MTGKIRRKGTSLTSSTSPCYGIDWLTLSTGPSSIPSIVEGRLEHASVR